MARQDNYRDDWDDEVNESGEDFEVDEATEFARRQQGVKRESAKRMRAAEKSVRQEREGELSQLNKHKDRRAIDKASKRRFAELKRIANELAIKQTLQKLSENSSQICWGPDVVSDKERPSVGVVLNYTDQSQPQTAGGVLTPSLFGAWLYNAGAEIIVTVGSKEAEDAASQTERARPPRQDRCVLRLTYNEENHNSLQEKLTAALLEKSPLA